MAPAPLVTYQGRLVESGAVVTADRVFTFAIHDSGGTELWNSGDLTLTVTNGLYSAVLGGTGTPAIPTSLLGTAGLTLRVTVGGQALTPDVALVPAMQARSAWEAVNVTGTVAIANGGTGATDAAAARTNLGLGSAATAATADFASAAQGAKADTAVQPADLHLLLPWTVVSGTSQAALGDHGYIASSSDLTTITAPAAPAAGQVLDIAGSGTGGWSLTLNAGQSILLGEEMATSLPAGTHWSARGTVQNWQCVASSSDGAKLAATIDSGQIHTSADGGATWTPRGGVQSWIGIASSSDGTKLVACAFGGHIYTSADSGATWTARDSVRYWLHVASSGDGTRLLACGQSQNLYTSTNSGATWTARDAMRYWQGVASSSDGTKLAACVGGGQIYTSTDSGATWTARDANRSWSGMTSSSDGTKLAACVGNGQIYTSTNSGVSWTARESARSWRGIASSSDGTRLVACVQDGRIFTSADSGATWTQQVDNGNEWSGIASSSDGSRLAATAVDGQIHTSSPLVSLITSSDGYTLTGGVGSSIGLLWTGPATALLRHARGSLEIR